MNHTMIIAPEMITNTKIITDTDISKYKMQKRKEHTGFYNGSNYSYAQSHVMLDCVEFYYYQYPSTTPLISRLQG